MAKTPSVESMNRRMMPVFAALSSGPKTMQQIVDAVTPHGTFLTTSYCVNRMIKQTNCAVITDDGNKLKTERLYTLIDGISEELFKDAVFEMYLGIPGRGSKGITRESYDAMRAPKAAVVDAEVVKMAAAKKTEQPKCTPTAATMDADIAEGNPENGSDPQ